ncbi:MAG TPA: hypothetical protein VIV60_23485, partial [Polyangiaceae bacterium]
MRHPCSITLLLLLNSCTGQFVGPAPDDYSSEAGRRSDEGSSHSSSGAASANAIGGDPGGGSIQSRDFPRGARGGNTPGGGYGPSVKTDGGTFSAVSSDAQSGTTNESHDESQAGHAPIGSGLTTTDNDTSVERLEPNHASGGASAAAGTTGGMSTSAVSFFDVGGTAAATKIGVAGSTVGSFATAAGGRFDSRSDG